MTKRVGTERSDFRTKLCSVLWREMTFRIMGGRDEEGGV